MRSASPGESTRPLAERLGRIVTAGLETGAVLGVATDRETNLWSFGDAATANGVERMTTGHRFLLTSVAKPITCLQVLRLVDDGLLDIDEPVARYLADFGNNGKTAITARHLLSHTSGMLDRPNSVESAFAGWSARDHIVRALNARVVFAPGEGGAYCSTSYWILGELIAKCARTSFQRHLRDTLVAPLGLTSTGYAEEPHPPAGCVLPAEDQRRARVVAEYVRQSGYPAGGLLSTASDLLAIGRCLLRDGATDAGGRVLSAKSLDAVFAEASHGVYRGRSARWTLGGWELGGPGRRRGEGTLYKDGAAGTAMWLDRERGICCVLLTAEYGTRMRSLHGRVIDAVLGTWS